MAKKKDVDPELLYKTSQYEVLNIPVDQIQVPEDRFRAVHTEGSLSALRTTLDQLPLLNEIGVREADGHFELIYGESRFREFVRRKRATVPAKNWKVAPEEAVLMQLAENYARGTFDPVKLIDLVAELSDSGRYRQKELARLLNTTEPKISKLVAIRDYPDDIKALIAEGKLDIETAYELNVVKDPAARVGVAKTVVMSRYNRNQARDFVRHSFLELCDSCGRQQCAQKGHGYNQHEDKFYCDKCLKLHFPAEWKKLKTPTPAPAEAQGSESPGSATPSSSPATMGGPSPAPAGASPPSAPEIFRCDTCGKQFPAYQMHGLSLCDADDQRLQALLIGLETKLGKTLWSLKRDTIKDIAFVVGE